MLLAVFSVTRWETNIKIVQVLITYFPGYDIGHPCLPHIPPPIYPLLTNHVILLKDIS